MAMNNIMIDIEALDSNSETAALVSLGAVYFDLEKYELGDEFYREVSLASIEYQLNRLNRTCSLYTLQWWMLQSDKAREVFISKENQVTNNTLLEEFTYFCTKNCKVWGNGVDYDNVMLRSLYKVSEIPCPWEYRNNRCYRTIKALHGNRAKLVREGCHHNALDDAKTQAIHLCAMMKAVHKGK